MMQGFADLPIVEKTFLEANAILGDTEHERVDSEVARVGEVD